MWFPHQFCLCPVVSGPTILRLPLFHFLIYETLNNTENEAKWKYFLSLRTLSKSSNDKKEYFLLNVHHTGNPTPRSRSPLKYFNLPLGSHWFNAHWGTSQGPWPDLMLQSCLRCRQILGDLTVLRGTESKPFPSHVTVAQWQSTAERYFLLLKWLTEKKHQEPLRGQSREKPWTLLTYEALMSFEMVSLWLRIRLLSLPLRSLGNYLTTVHHNIIIILMFSLLFFCNNSNNVRDIFVRIKWVNDVDS